MHNNPSASLAMTPSHNQRHLEAFDHIGHRPGRNHSTTAPVTLRRCVIPLPDAAVDRPEIGGRPFPYWPMRELQRWGMEDFLLLAPKTATDLDPALPDRLAAILPRPATIRIARATNPTSERSLFCFALAVPDGDLSPFLRAAAATPAEAALALMMPDGPPDRSTAILTALPPGYPADGDALALLFAAGRLRNYPAAGAVYRLDEPSAAPPAKLQRAALFLDRDGVINLDHGYVGRRDRFEWTPDGRAAIQAATAAGHHVFVVTNQSGIARGFHDEAELAALHDWMSDEIRRSGGTIDDLRFCPFHPDAPISRYRRDSPDRKPAPGMILDLLRRWELDPTRCALIGDQPTDLAAAAAAGIDARLTRGGDLLPLLAELGIPTRPGPTSF